jgi:hypothetical protein
VGKQGDIGNRQRAADELAPTQRALERGVDERHIGPCLVQETGEDISNKPREDAAPAPAAGE